MAIDVERAEVKAAGCVVYRRAGDLEFALIHRPRYDDWSLPKGKLDPGESWAEAARREVEEEIGVRGELGEELEPVRYRDHKGRDKVVRYWLMEAGDDTPGFSPNDEVDELAWVDAEEASERLSYDVDRETLVGAAEALA
ncbi:MAG TPA: NUDIX domain-containing protein [Solirubrobacteraceae bacterium]|jgi:8-oxo-dGTP diphosphatase